MEKGITFVGLDAHKKTIAVAMLPPAERVPIAWEIPNEPASVRRMVRKVEREGSGEVRFCYEAGALGYSLQRQIVEAGSGSCMVVAPSLIPRKPGERIKTDWRDARKLAELFRAGLLTEVQPPTPEDEAVRDLCRAREDLREDLTRCRHRLGKMLLRKGMTFTTGKKAWTEGHRRWLRALRFEDGSEAVFDDYLLAIEQLEERLRGLEEKIGAIAQKEPYAKPVGWLRCYRGIDTVTAMTIVSELYGFERFQSPRGLMAFLGLVPSEETSSDKTHRGGITKTGNGHVRRVLIEAAWHYRHKPGTRSLRKRREGQPAEVIALADKAQHRLFRRYRRMTEAGKPGPKAVTAVARELAGFVWATLSRGSNA
ncbi:MAG TPA: IS110 family transposase [Vicinamibacteria bacterium]|nr:IS110 family transposase [Vicinamibacteria bacterium]